MLTRFNLKLFAKPKKNLKIQYVPVYGNFSHIFEFGKYTLT